MYQRIRDLREDRDLRQQDVAAYLCCTQVCYSNYENGAVTFQRRCCASWPTFSARARTICLAVQTRKGPIRQKKVEGNHALAKLHKPCGAGLEDVPIVVGM